MTVRQVFVFGLETPFEPRFLKLAQYQMSEIFELLHHLFLKNTKDSGMVELLESVLNQILQAQATQTTPG